MSFLTKNKTREKGLIENLKSFQVPFQVIVTEEGLNKND